MLPREVEQYAAVIFDCDGVIFDSNGAKSAAFGRVATSAGYPPAVVDAFVDWQSQNFGLSRYRAFGELMDGRFGDPDASPPEIADLLDRFGAEVEGIYKKAPFTEGFPDLLQRLESHPLYVASGSKQDELRVALGHRGIASAFTGIFGSPTPKSEIVRRIVDDVRGADSESRIVLIGDAHADADAAQSNGIDFVFLSGYSTVVDSMTARAETEGFPRIATLNSLFSDRAT